MIREESAFLISGVIPPTPWQGGTFVVEVFVTNQSYKGVAPGTPCAYTFGVTMDCSIGGTALTQQVTTVFLSAGEANRKVSFTFYIPVGVLGSGILIGRLYTTMETTPRELNAALFTFTVLPF